MNTVTLGELISFLETLPGHVKLSQGFSDAHSWRGDYQQVAFTPAPNVTVEEMLFCAKEAKVHIFNGYKGGLYTYDDSTMCHIDRWGYSCDEIPLTKELFEKWLQEVSQPKSNP